MLVTKVKIVQEIIGNEKRTEESGIERAHDEEARVISKKKMACLRKIIDVYRFSPNRIIV